MRPRILLDLATDPLLATHEFFAIGDQDFLRSSTPFPPRAPEPK